MIGNPASTAAEGGIASTGGPVSARSCVDARGKDGCEGGLGESSAAVVLPRVRHLGRVGVGGCFAAASARRGAGYLVHVFALRGIGVIIGGR